MDLRRHIAKRLAELEKELERTRLALSFCPEGSIIRSDRDNTTYFMWSFKDSDGKFKRQRLSKQPEHTHRLMRKKYLEVKLSFIEKNVSTLKYVLKNYTAFSEDDILATMPESYRRLPEELFFIPSEAEIASGIADSAGAASYAAFCESIGESTAGLPDSKAENWASKAYETSQYRSEERRHTTSRGLKVRSKAELLIAESLYKFEVPFHYEEVLHIAGRTFIPDFTIMKSDGSLCYWEHCGLMNDARYRAKFKEKLEFYEAAGIVLWKNLILTFDDDEGGINLSIVESEIKNKLV